VFYNVIVGTAIIVIIVQGNPSLRVVVIVAVSCANEQNAIICTKNIDAVPSCLTSHADKLPVETACVFVAIEITYNFV
jgi:hypothetical protein